MEHMASIWKRLEAGTPGRKCQKLRYTSSKVLVAIVLMQGTAAVRIDLQRTDVFEQDIHVMGDVACFFAVGGNKF